MCLDLVFRMLAVILVSFLLFPSHTQNHFGLGCVTTHWHQQQCQGLGCVMTHWHQQERQGLGCVTTHWHQQEHPGVSCITTHGHRQGDQGCINLRMLLSLLGLCHNTLAPAMWTGVSRLGLNKILLLLLLYLWHINFIWCYIYICYFAFIVVRFV